MYSYIIYWRSLIISWEKCIWFGIGRLFSKWATIINFYLHFVTSATSARHAAVHLPYIKTAAASMSMSYNLWVTVSWLGKPKLNFTSKSFLTKIRSTNAHEKVCTVCSNLIMFYAATQQPKTAHSSIPLSHVSHMAPQSTEPHPQMSGDAEG